MNMSKWKPVLVFTFLVFKYCCILAQSSYGIYFFLLEDCKISQAYCSEMKRLHKEFANDSVAFTAYFPNSTSTKPNMDAFMHKYKLPMKYYLDSGRAISDQYQVSVLPEVVVVNLSSKTVLYQGRIDNLFVAIGKRRNKATEHDLKDVLKGIHSGKQLAYRKTEAVGCFLSRFDY